MNIDRGRILQATDRVAETLAPRAAGTVRGENLYKHAWEVASVLQRTGLADTVCDLGGGVGINLLILRELGHSGRLVLIDQLDEYDGENRMGSVHDTIGLLEARGVEVVRQDFWSDPHLPLETGTAAVTTCFDVVEHLPGHPLRQLRELHRILRSGGSCVISGPNGVSFMKRVKSLSGRYPYAPFEAWMADRYHEHYREYVRPEYEEILRRAGFSDVGSRASADVTLCRARRGYWRGHRAALDPVRVALWGMAAVEAALPGMRHTIYAWGRKA